MFGLIPFENKEMDSIFNDGFFDGFKFPQVHQDMKCDVEDTEKSYIVTAEVAGFDKNDIKVSTKDDVLTIAVEHKEDTKDDKKYLCHERSYSKVSRSFRFPSMNKQDIKANLKDGILTITVNKDEKQEDKYIAIE